MLLPFSVVVFVLGICLAVVGGAGFVLIWLFLGVMALLSRFGFGKQEAKKQPDTVTSLSLASTPEELPAPSPELRRELGELCLLHAVFAERAAAERFLQTKELPEGIEVVTRRKHIDLLREYGIYDRLRDNERTLLLMPQGHWTGEVIDACAMALEPLRLLRWVLRLDEYLSLVGDHLQADFSLSRSTFEDPARVFADNGFIQAKTLETAIQSANVLGYRCWSEGVARGFFVPEDEEEAEQARSYAAKFAGDEGGDFLLGNVIVSRAEEADVRLAGTLAYRRRWVLNWVLGRWRGVEPELEGVQIFYAPNAHPAETE